MMFSAALAASLAATTAPVPSVQDTTTAASAAALPSAALASDATASVPPEVSPKPEAGPADAPVKPDASPGANPDGKADALPAASPGSREIVVSGARVMNKIDPVEGINKVTFQTIESVDKAVIGPIMHIYRDDIPRPVRQGLHNFFFNLTEPVNAINYMLQLHPGKALQTVARFGINSTVGIGGLIDVAKKKPFNIHYRPNGFGNTLGYWGIGPGPYLFLPLVGPTSVRDLIGSLLDQVPLPLLVKPLKNFYYVTAAGVITELDYRVDIDAGVERVRKTGNVYASYRQAYFRSRFEEIEALHGRGPLARGEVGQAPFVQPLYPEPDPAAAKPAAPPALTPVPAAPSPPAAAAPAPAPAAAPAPVFISVPIIQPVPVVQPLPPGYRPGHS
jgi:phospholipid-binding lipoprotein MlaA